MTAYQLTGKAKQDLADIISYTQTHWGKSQTKTYITDIRKSCQLLADNPGIGRKCDNIAAGVLSHPVKSHIIYYFYQGSYMTILRILHKRMLPSKYLSAMD
jgi:toxin ParE1/3/4